MFLTNRRPCSMPLPAVSQIVPPIIRCFRLPRGDQGTLSFLTNEFVVKRFSLMRAAG
jgi:hypothetical protein